MILWHLCTFTIKPLAKIRHCFMSLHHQLSLFASEFHDLCRIVFCIIQDFKSRRLLNLLDRLSRFTSENVSVLLECEAYAWIFCKVLEANTRILLILNFMYIFELHVYKSPINLDNLELLVTPVTTCSILSPLCAMDLRPVFGESAQLQSINFFVTPPQIMFLKIKINQSNEFQKEVQLPWIKTHNAAVRTSGTHQFTFKS